jgi:hypothetical protein
MWIDLSQHMFFAPGHAPDREAEQSEHPPDESRTDETHGPARQPGRHSKLTTTEPRRSAARNPRRRQEPGRAHADDTSRALTVISPLSQSSPKRR